MEKIIATEERAMILVENNIPYDYDDEFYFIFKCPKDEDRARIVLRNALLL